MTLLIAAVILGGLGNTAIGLTSGNPTAVVGMRFAIACLLLSPWIPRVFRLPRLLLAAAVLEVLAVAALWLAVSFVSVAAATTVMAAGPLIAAAADALTGRGKTTLRITGLLILSTGGTILIATESSEGSTTVIGITLAIVGLTLGTWAALLNGWHGKDTSPVVRTCAVSLLGTVMLAPFLLPAVLTPGAFTTTDLAVAVFIAVGPGILGWTWTLAALKTIPVPVVMASGAAGLGIAAGSSWLILGQALGTRGVIGVGCAAAAITGLAWIEYREADAAASRQRQASSAG